MKKLGIVGGGNMAEALVRGLLKRRVFRPADLIVSDINPSRTRRLARLYKVATTAHNRALLRDARVIVLAVKPQTVDAVLEEIALGLERVPDARRRAVRQVAAAREKLFISIAAGVTLAQLRHRLGEPNRVVRVMPNAPAMVGHGMAALIAGPGVSTADMAFATRIFAAVGEVVVLEDERLMDAVTALSGSGPAYVYLFAQALAEAAAKEGLPAALASKMALETIDGAVAMMRESKSKPAELISTVASPGGTTEAALRRFAEAGFSDIVAAAVRAAAARSRELGRSG